MLNNNVAFWKYELGAIVSVFAGWSLRDFNEVLQTGILLLGFVSAVIALYKSIKHKKAK